MNQRGFTVIELVLITALLATIGVVFFMQKAQLESVARDDTRRVAINAMYYNLEEVFYKDKGFYPQTISERNLPAMDKELFTDPDGNKLGAGASDYRYEPLGCDEERCDGYTLRAVMENEADFVKSNRSHDE